MGGPVSQDFNVNGVVVTFCIRLTPTLGTHTYNVKARLSDDSVATASVNTSHGQLTALNTRI